MAIKDSKEGDTVSEARVGDVSVLHGSTPALHTGCDPSHLKTIRHSLLNLPFRPHQSLYVYFCRVLTNIRPSDYFYFSLNYNCFQLTRLNMNKIFYVTAAACLFASGLAEDQVEAEENAVSNVFDLTSESFYEMVVDKETK